MSAWILSMHVISEFRSMGGLISDPWGLILVSGGLESDPRGLKPDPMDLKSDPGGLKSGRTENPILYIFNVWPEYGKFSCPVTVELDNFFQLRHQILLLYDMHNMDQYLRWLLYLQYQHYCCHRSGSGLFPPKKRGKYLVFWLLKLTKKMAKKRTTFFFEDFTWGFSIEKKVSYIRGSGQIRVIFTLFCKSA